MRQNKTPVREVAFDCRFFLGDRPCSWHKYEGALCTCDHYNRISENLLIIKLDAMGDVLRTTTLLPAIAKEHPQASITWITRVESEPLLRTQPIFNRNFNIWRRCISAPSVPYV